MFAIGGGGVLGGTTEGAANGRTNKRDILMGPLFGLGDRGSGLAPFEGPMRAAWRARWFLDAGNGLLLT